MKNSFCIDLQRFMRIPTKFLLSRVASRSPFRPNGLGLSSVKIVEVKESSIDVRGADLMNGTPIYDIKPYLSYVDSHIEARGGFTDEYKWNCIESGYR